MQGEEILYDYALYDEVNDDSTVAAAPAPAPAAAAAAAVATSSPMTSASCGGDEHPSDLKAMAQQLARDYTDAHETALKSAITHAEEEARRAVHKLLDWQQKRDHLKERWRTAMQAKQAKQLKLLEELKRRKRKREEEAAADEEEARRYGIPATEL